MADYAVALEIGEQLAKAQKQEREAAEAYCRKPDAHARARWFAALYTLERLTIAYLEASAVYIEVERSGPGVLQPAC